MARLDTSVHPEHSTAERDQAHIRKVGGLGRKRIFTHLLSVGNKGREQVASESRLLAGAAHECGMEIIPDVSPTVFSKIGISYEGLLVFQDMHVDGIRLNEGFGGMKESLMIYNPQGLKIELNASTQLVYAENIINHHPDRSKLVTCHSFYPWQYSGLSLKHFNKCSEKVKPMYLPVATFISSSSENTYSPRSVNEGLYTLEVHRGLPIGSQARHLFATGIVDDVLIANACTSAEELKVYAAVNPSILTFELTLKRELTRTGQEILDCKPKHVIRDDMSEYMIRSTWPRVTFADESIPAASTRDLKRGDVVILNDGYLKYRGGLHIVLKDMPNDGRKSVIGHLSRYEHVLLSYVEPWRVSAFYKA